MRNEKERERESIVPLVACWLHETIFEHQKICDLCDAGHKRRVHAKSICPLLDDEGFNPGMQIDKRSLFAAP